jgi:S1-C subfamily serine protease
MRQSLFEIAGGLALATLLCGAGNQLHAQQSSGGQSQATAAEGDGSDDPPSVASDAQALPLPQPDAERRDFENPPNRLDGNARVMNRRDFSDSARSRADISIRGRADLLSRTDVNRAQNFNLGISFGGVGRDGLRVDTIERNSMFFDSGLRRGDVIVSVFGRPIRSEVDFVTLVRSRPGAPIPVVVLRDGREEVIHLTFQEVIQPEPVVVYQQPQVVVDAPGFLGVMFDTEFPEVAIVRSVFPDSPAARTGLRAGDKIVALNGEAVSTYRSAVEMIDEMSAGEPLVITFTREVQNQAETLLAARPGTAVRTATRPIDIRVSAAPPPVVIEQPAAVRVVPTLPPATR